MDETLRFPRTHQKSDIDLQRMVTSEEVQIGLGRDEPPERSEVLI